jgi:hypothetical protein
VNRWKALLPVAATALAIASEDPLAAAADRHSPFTWTAPVEVAAGGGQRGPWRQNDSKYDYVDDPAVAFDGSGGAAVAWVDQRRKDVLFQIYGPNGKPRFAQPVNVSRTPEVFSWLPRIVISPVHPKDVYVLWQEIVFSGGSHGGDIFFARSLDGGATFAKPINLSASRGGDGKGRITRDIWHNGSLDLAIAQDGTLYAAWTEYDGPLWLARSHNRGESFTTPILIAGGGNDSPTRAPALAVAPGNTVYLAWTPGENAAADIHVARSDDGGRTFARPSIVARTGSYSDAPKLAVDSKGVLHVVHAESAGGPFDRYHVRYARSLDRGRTFEPGRDISKPHPDGADSAAFPALALDVHGSMHVLWELFARGAAHPRGLAIVHSRDEGLTFTVPVLVPGSSDPAGGSNGSQQGLLMRKLAANGAGELAVVNSSLKAKETSRVWLVRGWHTKRGSAESRAP